ncbi:hypothetical protein ACEQ8H_008820 [Pleosporales sp. CAS-2024a]
MDAAQSADDDASSRPDTPTNRSTKGFCKTCGTSVGEYYNSWHKITKSYYGPALLGSYHSLLIPTGRQKPASRGTAIEGCTIQPLSCPSSTSRSNGNCSETPIGFTVIDAPTRNKNLRGRDFFKLGRIELRCKVSSNKIIVVEPREDTALDLSIVDDSDLSSPASSPTSINTMDVDSRPTSLQHTGVHQIHLGQRNDFHQSVQPLQKTDTNKQSLPPLLIRQSPTMNAPPRAIPLKTLNGPLPSVSPAVRPYETASSARPPSREVDISPMSGKEVPRAASSEVRSLSELHSNVGSTYPHPPGETSLDAIERLQTQVSQNSGALAAHTRDIRRGEESFQALEATLRREFATQVQHQAADIQRVDEAVARMHLEMQGIRQALETVSHELAISRAEMQRGVAVPSGPPSHVPNGALELMAQQVASMSHKTSELDNLRVTVEIMKEKIYSLEQGAKSAKPEPASQMSPRIFQPAYSSSSSHAHNTTTSHTAATATPRAQSPNHTPPQHSEHPSTTLSEPVDTSEPAPSQRPGWASINAGTKRTHMAGMVTSRDGDPHAPSSPKRQKVAGHTYSQNNTPSYPYEHEDSEDADSRVAAPPSTLLSTHVMSDSDILSEARHALYGPIATQHGPLDYSWRAVSQHVVEHRPRGRGRGGGPGSRGGRVRKSMPAPTHHQLGMSEWEGEDWQGVSESQAGPEGHHNHIVRSGRGIARRGSGGGGRGGYAQSERAASLGSQGLSPGFSIGSPNDPYAHTKKTRTKPIRNADGVLIRKDGRPDMRSSSSAANLRKVHARKEGEVSTQGSPTALAPTKHHHAALADVSRTSSPSGHADVVHGETSSSVQRKHSAIIGKMFPSGLDESRRQNDYAHQVFKEDCDVTAHPRTPHNQSAIQINQEPSVQHEPGEATRPNSSSVSDGQREPLSASRAGEEAVPDPGEPIVPDPGEPIVPDPGEPIVPDQEEPIVSKMQAVEADRSAVTASASTL